MAAFVARFERPTEPERDEYRRHSTLCECFSLRGHRLVRFRNCFGKTPQGPWLPGSLVSDIADIDDEQAALWLEQSVYSRPTTRFWVVQSNGRSTCGVSFKSASSPRSAIASTIFGARNASRMRRAT
jgi:hypothetical protein